MTRYIKFVPWCATEVSPYITDMETTGHQAFLCKKTDELEYVFSGH
jgi:hypothetical protein